jgi:hypothetical protein
LSLIKQLFFMKKFTFKPILLNLLGLIATSIVATGQTIITQWDFEQVASTTNPAPSFGSGTASAIGMTPASGTFAGTNNGCTQTSGTNAWQFNPATPGSSNETNGAQFLVSTVGFQNIYFEYDHRFSGTATRTVRIQYTLDGTNWLNLDVTPSNYSNSCSGRGGIDNGRIDVSDPVGSNLSDSWSRRIINFSAISGANNNPNFGVRVVAAHYSTTGEFRQANNVNSIATGGAWRFDNVTFKGDPIGATTFYNKTTGDLNLLSTWGTNPDGTGTPPASFTAANQIFVIANGNPGIFYTFEISGANSKVVIGDGINPIQVSLDPTAAGTGQIIAPVLDIAEFATFITRTNNFPTLGIIAPGSTFRYTGPSSLTLNVVAASYGNLELLGSATKNLPDASFSIAGNLTLAGTINTNSTTFRTITFTGDSIKLNTGVNMQPGSGNSNTTQRNTNIEMSSVGNQWIWAASNSDTLRIGRLISTKSSGSLNIAAPIALYNRIILNYTGTAQFNDGGQHILIGDNIEAQGLTSAYNLTGTFEIRRLDGSTSNHNIRRDGANNDNPAVCEFNNLILNSSNFINFRPTSSISASYTVKGNLLIQSSANLIDFGTNNTFSVTGNLSIVSDTLVVFPGGRLSVGGSVTNNGVIELRASAANGAALLKVNGAVPNVRVSQHIEGTSGTGKWIHTRMPVAAPLNSVVASSAIMFINSASGSVYRWDANQASYIAPTSATDAFTSAEGWVLYVGDNQFGTFVNSLPATITTSSGTIEDQSQNYGVSLLYNDGQSSPFLIGPVAQTQG